MRRFARYLPLIALLAAPLQVFGGTTASMQVSFTIVASCTVNDRGATAPGVNCMQADGFIVAHNQVATSSRDASAGTTTGSSAAGWTVYF